MNNGYTFEEVSEAIVKSGSNDYHAEVLLAARASGANWFGVAWSGATFVATAVGATEAECLHALKRCLPAGLALGVNATLHDGPSAFFDWAVPMLASLEAGDESRKQYTFSAEYLSEPMYRIYSVAAAIPLGWVTTYGAVARTAGSEARAVGRAMATNPLYPIVPCHRVVGSDMSLVGYGGKQDESALAAKLARLEAEAQGKISAVEAPTDLGPLEVYPVEWLIRATREADARRLARSKAEEAHNRADEAQLRLF